MRAASEPNPDIPRAAWRLGKSLGKYISELTRDLVPDLNCGHIRQRHAWQISGRNATGPNLPPLRSIGVKGPKIEWLPRPLLSSGGLSQPDIACADVGYS